MLEEVLMAAVLLFARFALIVVFGVAGLTKLGDREGSLTVSFPPNGSSDLGTFVCHKKSS
jgi:hypothetical protein